MTDEPRDDAAPANGAGGEATDDETADAGTTDAGTTDAGTTDDGTTDDGTTGADGAERGDESRRPGADPLVIRSLDFMGGMATTGGWRPDNLLPEVAFVGRSNVGKSSLLNRLVRRKAFARVSNTPGRTREINFFKVNDAFVFVDLPGYGYARVSKERRREWKPLMEGYLRFTRQLRGIVMLLDARRDPSDDDMDMLDFLAELEIPVLLAVTKVDKLRPREVAARIAALAGALEVDEDQLIPFSAVTSQGRDELAEAITTLVQAPAWSRS